jgi:hypothetical protein
MQIRHRQEVWKAWFMYGSWVNLKVNTRIPSTALSW